MQLFFIMIKNMKKAYIGGFELKNRYIQAPLAGYTNRSMRELAYMCGASLTYTEMISCSAIFYHNKKTIEMIPTKKENGILALQIFDGDYEKIKSAITVLNDIGVFDILDFNMGCPVTKVIKQHAGSYWLKRENELYDLLRMMVSTSIHPVTIKTRIGYDRENINIGEIIKIAHAAGISAVAIHGRTRNEFYLGSCDYQSIKFSTELGLLPIIASGDINLKNFEEVEKNIGCEAYMFGRSSLGNPLIFADLIKLENGETITKRDLIKQIEFMKKHFSLLKNEFGERGAVMQMRGISPFYLKGFNDMSRYKSALVRMNSEHEFLDIINAMK